MVSTEIGGVRSCSFYNAQHIHFEPVGPTEGRDDTIYEEMLSLTHVVYHGTKSHCVLIDPIPIFDNTVLKAFDFKGGKF